MRLALSSAAAPTASLQELLDACVRRGLPALELEEGHGHGLDVGMARHQATTEARERAASQGVEIAGFRLATPFPLLGDGTGLADFARALGAPLLVPLAAGAPAGADGADGADGEGWAAVPETARRLIDRLAAAGAPVRPVLPTAGGIPGDLQALEALPLAWDADPTVTELSAPARTVLEGAGARLVHIRLMGGGPEATEQEGRGVGALMAHLALAGYDGTVALAPSSPRYRVIWDAWLGRRGGWGCGSHAEDRSLVSLAGTGPLGEVGA